MRSVRHVFYLAAVLGSLLGVASPALAATPPLAAPLAANAVPDFSFQAFIYCLNQPYVKVTNNSGAAVDVKATVNGQPWGSTVTIANGADDTVGYGTPLPATSGNVEIYQVGTPDVLIGTVPFSREHCDDLEFTYDDKCATIDVTIKNLSGTDHVVTFAQTSGSTFAITVGIPVPAGQTVQVAIGVTDTNLDSDTPQIWYEIGAHVPTASGIDYVSRYDIKGTDGGCVPATDPEPNGSLPVTGPSSPIGMMVAAGATLLVLGVVGLLIARRSRRA